MIKTRSAFSLIEVIFVLVILGIVASISSSIIAQVYENYITQKALYKVTTKTELASNQIVNRLTYRIPGTTIAKNRSSGSFTEGVGWIMLKDIPKSDNNFTTVEWIGYDNDSFAAAETPGWSGVANYETASKNSMITPASKLSSAAAIMTNLSKSKVRLTSAKPAAILFSQKSNQYRNGLDYNVSCMGLIDPTKTECIFRVARNGDTNLTFVKDYTSNIVKPKIVTERYKLAWSAYALVPIDEAPIGDGLFNLYLYFNYQPWNGEKYTDGQQSLLVPNISVFKFTENGGVIQFKLCASENIGQKFNISTCKEKVIIR
jgi:prepilin-type N-terminal cleavage/methylation domain-containing protein